MEVLALQKLGWPPLAARAIADGMIMPAWKDEWHSRCADWCSAHEKEGIAGMAGFLNWTLTNPYEGVGRALKAAATQEEADAALDLFWKVVRQ
jgi:hypothetical protein